MANRNLFPVRTAPATVVNNAGGIAYKAENEHALAQLVCTGTFNGTFYASGEDTLNEMKKLVGELRRNPEFIAKLAVYSRDNAYMKDAPAYLVAVLAAWGEHRLFHAVFNRVIDNGKMLRNFVQIGRSGQAGRVLNMSCSSIRRAIGRWFQSKSPEYIFNASIGNDPSMRDMLRMCRPKPESAEKAALYAYLKGATLKDGKYETYDRDGKVMYAHSEDLLPKIVQDFERFKASKNTKLFGVKVREEEPVEVPNVDFRLLDSIVSPEEAKILWEKQIDRGWHGVRMNLNNFEKYGVFTKEENVRRVADRLRDRAEILRNKVFPYQLLVAYLNSSGVPTKVRNSLQDAMEIAVENTPRYNGKVVVGVDVSGSMSAPVTGYRAGATTVVNCKQVAALFASSVLRQNEDATVLPFTTTVHPIDLNSRDSVMTNTEKLARLPSGGTACSSPVKWLNDRGQNADLVVILSDNQSWADAQSEGTALMKEWNKFKQNNPKAKLVCVDLAANTTQQVVNRSDILRVGGFSDECFRVIQMFLDENSSSKEFWTRKINEVAL